jgi:hypothetical protein
MQAATWQPWQENKILNKRNVREIKLVVHRYMVVDEIFRTAKFRKIPEHFRAEILYHNHKVSIIFTTAKFRHHRISHDDELTLG